MSFFSPRFLLKLAKMLRKPAFVSSRPMRSFFSRRKGCSFALFVIMPSLWGPAQAQPAPAGGEPAAPVLRIGIQALSSADLSGDLTEPTLAALEAALPEHRFELKVLDEVDLSLALIRKEVELFVATSGFYAYVEANGSGASWLATRSIPQALHPNASTGSLFIARAENQKINDIADLRTARVAAVSKRSFSGWYAALGEIANVTKYPENYFGKATFTGGDGERVAKLVAEGGVDAGILPACAFEHLIAAGVVKPGVLKTIGEKDDSDFACRVSTALYPGIVFAARSDVPAELQRRAAAALLSMPRTQAGYGWTVANDFRNVRRIVRRFGYAPVASETSSEIVDRYKYALLIGFLLLSGAVFYSVAVSGVVTRRTKALVHALDEKSKLERHAQEDRERLSQLERAGIVSELSSMIAHELRQPVASLINYADGLSIYLSGSAKDAVVGEATREIVRQAERVSEIVERVRAYAKGRSNVDQSVDLCAVTKRAFNTFRSSTDLSGIRVSADLCGEAPAKGDPLELELLIVNLLKNALQALRATDSRTGTIAIRLRPAPAQPESAAGGAQPAWLLEVEDDGPTLSDEKFRDLSQPVTSDKFEGLGLGLSICRVIAERHRARLGFVRQPGRGLVVRLVMPRRLDG